MSLFATHPSDRIARHTAHDATFTTLCLHFEDIVLQDTSMPERYGALQVLCSQAIARVALLEQQERDARSNVVPLKRVRS